MTSASSASSGSDPLAPLRSRSYLVLLVLAAIIGAPISAAAFGFLALVSHLQGWIFISLPKAAGLGAEPLWWPLPWLALAGILVALTIRYLPGTAGHRPAEGFKAGSAPGPAELPGVLLAALATLCLGVVLGPEAPLIALGGGLAICAVRLAKRDAPPQARTTVAAAGSFAAVSALFGSPLPAAFLLMEASGVAGATLELVLVPGLLAAGIGSLIFLGLGHWTGLGTFSLTIPHLPHVGTPDAAEFGWALVIGVAAAFLGHGIRRLGLVLQAVVERRMLLIMPVAGLAIAGLAAAYGAGSGRGPSDVLFSGQNALGPLITHGASYTAAVLVLLVACKGLAYCVSLSGFRGGPVFPTLLIGAAGGIALSHVPGLHLIPGAAMAMGALFTTVLGLPLTAVLLVTLFLGSDGVAVMPLVIVAVVVAFVLSARLAPPSAGQPPGPAPAGDQDVSAAASAPSGPGG
ncbi:MAG TPA: chloride channel protein [Streptosporangiaceae bacterium]|nr:chloride channel protein [Streptosporangiaceae bacterium]